MSSKLLLDEHPLIVLPSLALKIGLNEAIVLQQVHYWLILAERTKDTKKFIEARWWTFGTYKTWQSENFPWWSINTVGRTFRSLEKAGLLLTLRPDASEWNQTKWYTIEYTKLESSSVPLLDDGKPQDGTILNRNPETSSETSSEIRSAPPVQLQSAAFVRLATVPGFQEKWNEWIDYRVEIRKPLRDTTFRKQMQFLDEHRAEAVAILEQSMVNGWQGLFPLKNGKPNGAMPKTSAHDRSMAALAEVMAEYGA